MDFEPEFHLSVFLIQFGAKFLYTLVVIRLLGYAIYRYTRKDIFSNTISIILAVIVAIIAAFYKTVEVNQKLLGRPMY